jgi:RNA 2',3'-cyclic 3'-phosphodiesterase
MPRIRTFIAVGLDAAIHDRTMKLQETLARTAADEVKWVERDNLHVTLLFLGEVEDRQLHEVCRAVATGCAGHEGFTLTVGGVGAFPNLRRPRTLWVGLGMGTQQLIALHDDLEERLLELGCYRREERSYTPHITLGRIRGDEVSEPLVQALTKNANWQGGQMQVTEVLVMSSELTPKGPLYTVMSRAKFGVSE